MTHTEPDLTTAELLSASRHILAEVRTERGLLGTNDFFRNLNQTPDPKLKYTKSGTYVVIYFRGGEDLNAGLQNLRQFKEDRLSKLHFRAPVEITPGISGNSLSLRIQRG